MLYTLDWLNKSQSFPPKSERDRIDRYVQNQSLFEGDHFDSSVFRHYNISERIPINVYDKCASRISRVVGNFNEVISFPVLLNYQRLMSLKMADLVCGEPPYVTGVDSNENQTIESCRHYSDFDSKLYTSVIDISRYGDAILRVYKDTFGKKTFTVWDPKEWYPIVSQDGTNTILKHCLCWRENAAKSSDVEDWYLHVQIHGTQKEDIGHYEYRVYHMGISNTSIGKLVKSEIVQTDLDSCAVINLKAFTVSNSVYGYDDYMVIDSLLAEIMARVGQISVILDKHADPNITGPVSMLKPDPVTGELKLNTGKFYAVSQGEEQPKYMVWDGQLTSAFKELELLINQLYIISEMGAALLGSIDGGSQAISGTAMRFKMVNPLAKARRISNTLTRVVKILFSCIAEKIPVEHIAVQWEDGLPDDPRENLELAKLATGATKMIPLKRALKRYFNITDKEAEEWVSEIEKEIEKKQEENPNKPGPQDGTGVNPLEKGSETGLKSFKGLNNK